MTSFVPGPGFPDRRHHRRRPRRILEAYETGRGGFRVRARWQRRIRAAAPGRSSSPKFPIRCRRRRLIEKIAELLTERKLPLLDDVRDESAEDIRLVLSRRAAPSIPAC